MISLNASVNREGKIGSKKKQIFNVLLGKQHMHMCYSDTANDEKVREIFKKCQ